MDYFDSFDCQVQADEYGIYNEYYNDCYEDDCYCTRGSYFVESANYPSEYSFETLFDEF